MITVAETSPQNKHFTTQDRSTTTCTDFMQKKKAPKLTQRVTKLRAILHAPFNPVL